MSHRRNLGHGNGKRKYSALNMNEESVMPCSPKQSNLLTQIDNVSPVSSPLKGPLVEDGTESGSPAFVAKCFYGLKGSLSTLSKENHKSPTKKNVRRGRQLSGKNDLKILPDVRLNEKLLDRIAASPIKQAVLETCSVDEFRRMYRDEIREIEQQEKVVERRVTRRLSKIVWKKSEETDEEDFDDDDGCDNSSNSSNRIIFKISNRGLDIDSISNGSSSVKSDMMTPLKVDRCAYSTDDAVKDRSPSSKIDGTDEILKDPHMVSTSGRKFFKSKSVGKNVAASNVLLGKGFNLRFVRESRSGGGKKNGKRSGRMTPQSSNGKKSFAEKLKLSFQSPLGSTVLTASSTESNAESTPHEASPRLNGMQQRKKTEKYNAIGFDDDGIDLLAVKKTNSRTYKSPKRLQLDYSSGNESPYDSMSDSSPVDQGKCKDQDTSSVQQMSMNNASDINEAESKNDPGSSKKLFPIFRNVRRAPKIKATSPSAVKPGRSGNIAVRSDQNQMIIDAGQKKFGATQCNVCGMVYCHSDTIDETAHAKFHKRLLEVLKFPGWKKERVVQEIPVDCARIVLVLSDDPRSHRKKVEEIYEVMGRELGFPGDAPFTNPYQKVFLYVSVDREIEGCCVAEPIKEGNRVIPGDMDSTDASGRRPWCCEKVPEPALLGISRLWVVAQKRRCGIAFRLVEAVQQWFDYGSLIPKDKIAFSDPTPDGRRFAHKFTGTPTFLVYKYK